MNVLLTGGAGFIGSNFLNLFVTKYPDYRFLNIDKLTYAANPLNLSEVENSSNYIFKKTCITSYAHVEKIIHKFKPDVIVNFAAESHVDRSILVPSEFIQTNIVGTFNLLEACRKHWTGNQGRKFIHISTDEVYGSLGETGFFTENSGYSPSSPYSASKASSDHLVRAYYHTYRLPAVITACSNNYGPYQFPEKMIPLMIINALEGKPLPVYGEGLNVRDWLYVEDHCRAIWKVIEKGRPGETYNIGGHNEWKNIDLVRKICDLLSEKTDIDRGQYYKLITFVRDRPGHDLRYAIDSSKITKELGWKPQETFETGLRKTIEWYLNNREWTNTVKSKEYTKWIALNYGETAATSTIRGDL